MKSWIKCRLESPEQSGDYLCIVQEELDICTWDSIRHIWTDRDKVKKWLYRKDKKGFSYSSVAKISKVQPTFWMPLPEMPPERKIWEEEDRLEEMELKDLQKKENK